VEILEKAGLDLVSIVNNHQWDCGHTNGRVTRDFLASKSILRVGQDVSPVHFETSGDRVRVIA